jgi:hypothetical protein
MRRDGEIWLLDLLYFLLCGGSGDGEILVVAFFFGSGKTVWLLDMVVFLASVVVAATVWLLVGSFFYCVARGDNLVVGSVGW